MLDRREGYPKSLKFRSSRTFAGARLRSQRTDTHTHTHTCPLRKDSCVVKRGCALSGFSVVSAWSNRGFGMQPCRGFSFRVEGPIEATHGPNSHQR